VLLLTTFQPWQRTASQRTYGSTQQREDPWHRVVGQTGISKATQRLPRRANTNGGSGSGYARQGTFRRNKKRTCLQHPVQQHVGHEGFSSQSALVAQHALRRSHEVSPTTCRPLPIIAATKLLLHLPSPRAHWITPRVTSSPGGSFVLGWGRGSGSNVVECRNQLIHPAPALAFLRLLPPCCPIPQATDKARVSVRTCAQDMVVASCLAAGLPSLAAHARDSR
jgi:hypothetical protein